jgi:hypothetical protein
MRAFLSRRFLSHDAQLAQSGSGCLGMRHMIDDLRTGLDMVKGFGFTAVSILIATPFGAAMLPLSGNFAVDAAIYFLGLVGLSVFYVRAARRHDTNLADIGMELLALIGGGFFAVLCGSLVLKAGVRSEHGPVLLGVTVFFAAACTFNLYKLSRYLR